MKFNDRTYALLGIPDLPINAFKHIGDRKIKPQGGISSFVDSVTGVIDDVVGGVSDVLADVDDTVNEVIPGGWATVAAVTAATVGLPLPVGTGTVVTTGANYMSPQLIANAAGATGGAAGAGLLSSVGGSSGANFMNPALISNAGGAVGGAAATTGLLERAASFLNVKPETLASFAPSALQGLLSVGGSYLQSEQAKKAAQTLAQAQVRAAQIAADAARFRPVGVTTRFGASNFKTDAAGNVIGAGYTPSAEITGYQDRLRTLAGQGMTDIEGARAAYQPLTGAAQNLFSLGQGYLAKTPEQAAQDYISKQQALLTPSRENQLAELRNRQFQTGRGGAATAQGGSLMNTSPEMAAYYNSLAQQDLVLAANADQEARNRITYGAGLFDTGANLQGRYYTGQTGAYAPFATAMDTSVGLENLAQQPLEMGINIGGRTTAGTAAGGSFLSQGITSAAQTMAPANAYSLGSNVLAGAANSPNVTGLLNNAFGVTPTEPTITKQQLIEILLGNKKSPFAA